MLPLVYEFRWDLGHVVFIGAFTLVACVIAATLVRVGLRTRRRLAREAQARSAPGRSMS